MRNASQAEIGGVLPRMFGIDAIEEEGPSITGEREIRGKTEKGQGDGMSTPYPIPVTMDLNEGRFLDLGCLQCHSDHATLGMATPVRMYLVALICDDCGEEMISWDQIMGMKGDC